MQESEQSKLLHPVIVALASVAMLAALFWFGWTLLLWFRWHPHLPWRDIFVVLGDLQPLLEGSSGWRDWLFLLEPHYAAHRIALPRLLVALDTGVFHGQGHVLYATGWFSLGVIVALYAQWSRQYFVGHRPLWWFSCGVLGVLLFAPAHFWNLVNAINVSWHLSFALAALSFAALLRAPDAASPVAWLSAYVLACLCAFTTFTGVVLWLLLPFLALGARPRVLLVTVGASVLCTVLYLNGISSDAAIAMSWQGDNPAVVEQIQQAGRAAVDSNSLGRIIHRTAQLLCWPMSEDRAALALFLFALSLPILALAGIRFLRAAFVRAETMHPWLKLCLLLAMLSLGVAVAIQLGRVIEQPNHAHGPSYERYNTIVAVYWAGVLGLVLGGVKSGPPVAVTIVMSLILAILYLLLKPGGHYLRQEIESLEVAARLYAAGEMPALRGKVDKKLLRFKPEFVYSFESLFEERKLAYMYPELIPLAPEALADCEPGLLTPGVSKPASHGYIPVSASVAYPAALIVRDLLLSRSGDLLGRLYPRHRGDFSPLSLISSRDNGWQGDALPDYSRADAVQISAIRPWGTAVLCTLPVSDPAVHRNRRSSDGRSNPDV